MKRLLLLPVLAIAAGIALALVSLGGANSKSVGGTMTASGTFTDHGSTYSFQLTAEETGPAAGQGNLELQIGGNGLTACSVHGPGATPGATPLAGVQCGGAFNQAVSIDGCKADLEAHGALHSDFPLNAIYLGSVTVDVRFKKEGANSGRIDITLYTPKEPIKIGGAVTGAVSLSTCP